VLSDLVASGDAQVDPAFTHEGGDVGGREEDQGDVEVGDEGNVEPVLAPKLDGGTL
jgi:hypothetical protein